MVRAEEMQDNDYRAIRNAGRNLCRFVQDKSLLGKAIVAAGDEVDTTQSNISYDIALFKGLSLILQGLVESHSSTARLIDECVASFVRKERLMRHVRFERAPLYSFLLKDFGEHGYEGLGERMARACPELSKYLQGHISQYKKEDAARRGAQILYKYLTRNSQSHD
jgi:hypothetical protein